VHFGWSATCVALAWFIAYRVLSWLRPKVDPDDALKERAAHLARLFPAAFVVMGHTHVPMKLPVNQGASTYVNLGSWAEEEDEEESDRPPDAKPATYRAARTHLVIHPQESGPVVAEFLAWSEGGPRRFVS
jgi:hypothetical protein